MTDELHNLPVRIGAVNYLNTRPLVYGLEQLTPDAEVIYDLPSRLADGLADNRYDVALIPSIETFQDPTYRVVSDACIGCRGPVLSVKLFSRVPVEKIRTLALDEGSRTSAVLVQILLHQRYRISPRLESLPIGSSLLEAPGDAVLVIGDRAIYSPAGHFAAVWDLGHEWNRWTGLPFVFAMWTARDGVELREVESALGKARDEGVRHLEKIAAHEAPRLGLTEPECLAYLRDHLNFYLGPRERQGLELFYQHAVRLGLAPEGVDLGLPNFATAG